MIQLFTQATGKKKTLEAYINEEEKRYIGGHFILDCSISDWRKGSAYVLVQYFNPIKCVFICINLNLLSKEHIYMYMLCNK